VLSVPSGGLRAVDPHHFRPVSPHHLDHGRNIQSALQFDEPEVCVNQRSVESFPLRAYVDTEPHTRDSLALTDEGSCTVLATPTGVDGAV
jgi:hypothetical protein